MYLFCPTHKDQCDLSVQRRKEQARTAVNRAVKNGTLKKLPCEVCGTTQGRIEGHHADYEYPLDVIWLCLKHHRELHKYIGFYDVVVYN